MPEKQIKNAKKIVIGAKQTRRAVEKEEAKVVYVARDAENRVTEPIVKLCDEKGIEVYEATSMQELGRACGIEVGSASVAIIK